MPSSRLLLPAISRSRAGYTLVEIMVVLTIIAVLAGSVMVLVNRSLEFGKTTRAESDVQAVSSALKAYQTRNYVYPSSQQGLEALVKRPSSQPVPRRWIQLLDEVPIDPWGNPYQYRNPGKRNPKDFDLYSFGPDKVESDDDIGNW